MPIEQSIYTCVRARRDTGTTGFGYYSFTKGFEALSQASQDVKRGSVTYAPPRNQELWWSTADEESVRDTEEEAAIRQHHPETFSYQPVQIGGAEKAVFSYGRNLGRDIGKSRPGNILVNLLAADSSDISGYPFSYYGCPELFVPYDTNYFCKQAEIAPLLPQPARMTKALPFTTEDVIRFINEGDRLDLLCSMFQYVLDHGDETQETRQLMVCDRKENMIYWIAALSLLLPEELAKQFSFTTYSFLASRPDQVSPVYEPVMFCGVYTPSVNGDEADDRATNYDYPTEAARSDAALFDFEKESFADNGMRSDQFQALIEASFDNDLQQLRDYQKFLMEKTTYRKLDNDYLRGYSFYLLSLYPEPGNLAYLAEAEAFAGRYGGGKDMRSILDKLMSQTVDKGVLGEGSEEMLRLAGRLYRNSPEQERTAVCDRFLRCLKHLLCTGEKTDYVALRTQIKDFCSGLGISYEERICALMPEEEIRKLRETLKKKWAIVELAKIAAMQIRSSRLPASGLRADTGMAALFRSLLYSILRDERNRSNLLGYFVELFGSSACQAALLEALYSDAAPELKEEIVRYTFGVIAGSGQSADSEFLTSLTVLRDPAMQMLFREIRQDHYTYDFDAITGIFNRVLTAGIQGCDAYYKEMLDCLLDVILPDVPPEKVSNIYRVYNFAKVCGLTEPKLLGDLAIAYKESVFSMENWYDLDSKRMEELHELMRAAGDRINGSEAAGDIQNLSLMNHLNAAQSDVTFLMRNRQPVLFELLDNRTKDVFISRIVNYLYQCCLREGTAVLPYQHLVAFTNPKQLSSPQNIITAKWLQKLLEEAPKKQKAQLAAELLAVIHLTGILRCDETVTLLLKKGLKFHDLEDTLNDARLGQRLTQVFGESDADADLRTLQKELEKGYEEEKSNTFLGKMKARFPFKKKAKDE